MDLSVVIKCSDDERVFRCIQSIDEKVEIIVSLTKNEKIQQELKRLGIKYYLSPKGNLGKTAANGFKIATYPKVILTDSDTTFGEGCIAKLNRALDKNLIAKAKIIFLSDRHVFLSKIVAEARDYINSFPIAYTPGLAVRKEIIGKIGGFLFHEAIPWAEDAELNYRIQKAGLPLAFVKDAFLYHAPTSVFHDLRSAFRIGMGKRVSVERAGRLPDEDIVFMLPKLLRGDSVRNLLAITRHKGPVVGAYSLLWNLFYHAGYHFQKYGRKYG